MKLPAIGTVIASLMLVTAAYAADPLPPVKAAEKPDTGAAATPAPAATAAPKADYVILQVGEDKVMRSEVEKMWKTLFGQGQAPDFDTFDESIRQNVVRGAVTEHLLLSEAKKAGADKLQVVQDRVAQFAKQMTIQTYVEDKIKDQMSDAKLREAYNKKVAEMAGQEEVHARHILVPTEEEAKKIYDDLKKGGNFEKIAKDKSKDPGSNASGGDLGYFTKDRMVPAFADAAFAMKKGEISKPVKSDFGWHIIKLEDRRKSQTKIPTFEEMKDKLREEVGGAAANELIKQMIAKTTVKYFGPDGKERPIEMDPKKAAAAAAAAAPASVPAAPVTTPAAPAAAPAAEPAKPAAQ